ncbi:hypothetical protein DY000_02026011 [Brassica cretica]|uniref:Malic enzyme NAD-binding domain-containing protein n=1 Tax=Brassica cretica TaxID=69181 RepID=A0ABQ7EF66_BRACR|nr:hypothetical protein DY000_02026011 [Brassica cretica]
MCAVKQNYGEKVLVQFEGFANHHAFELLSKYCSSHLVLNDDIQGTASMVLAGLIAAQKVLGKSLADHTFLFLGAGEAGTGIAELIALKISKETGTPIDETRKKIWLVDSKGLIVSSHKESLQHFKQPWAHDHEPVNELLGAVNAIKPTVLIGTSGVGKTFTKEVVEAMATFNEGFTPLILALSNPTSQAECTAEQAYTWTQGRAIFASGSPFDPVEYEGKTFFPGQGTASVVLAGLIAAQKVLGKSLSDHTFLFLGAGEAGTGIAELIALKISKETGTPIDEIRKKIWLVDSKGLIVSSRKESLQHFKQPWAHDHEPVKELLGAVNAIKPTVLIGTSGVGKTFTKEVVEAMATFNEKPLILALSNPTSQAECTAKEAYTWTEGRAIFASGSPFAPVEYEGKTFFPGQANNCYIFPGLGLGLIMSGAIRVRDDMLLAASEALASQVTEENFADGLIYPPFTNIRKISANIAASVGAKTYELGLASNLPRPKDLVKMAESCMYSPVYRNFR